MDKAAANEAIYLLLQVIEEVRKASGQTRDESEEAVEMVEDREEVYQEWSKDRMNVRTRTDEPAEPVFDEPDVAKEKLSQWIDHGDQATGYPEEKKAEEKLCIWVNTRIEFPPEQRKIGEAAARMMRDALRTMTHSAVLLPIEMTVTETKEY